MDHCMELQKVKETLKIKQSFAKLVDIVAEA
jgi:hypothetical protein